AAGGGGTVSSGGFCTHRPCAVHTIPSPQSAPGVHREMHLPCEPQCEPAGHSRSSVHWGSAMITDAPDPVSLLQAISAIPPSRDPTTLAAIVRRRLSTMICPPRNV